MTLYYEFADYNLGAFGKRAVCNIDQSIADKDLISSFESIA
ncbi:hypothetical protein [Psychrobacter arcticus]|nr:hypothetical protein [Psychrobacter arcticus]